MMKQAIHAKCKLAEQRELLVYAGILKKDEANALLCCIRASRRSKEGKNYMLDKVQAYKNFPP